MATPIGHTLAGYLGYQLMPSPKHSLSQVRLWGAIALANLPDLDFLPGLLMGNAFAFHRRGSHTIIAALLVGSLVALSLRLARRWGTQVPKFSNVSLWQWGVWATAVYLGHLCLDFLMADRIPPYGLQLLWPFSDVFFIAPIALIPGFNFEAIVSWHNLAVVGIEIVWLVPMIWLAGAIATQSEKS
ncbi:MAG: metal-dependent hydrolase [Cyanobacteria bacterium J06639_14]